MDIHWHDYAGSDINTPITKDSLSAKASVIGRVGIMMLSCGTGAWRVRSSMNHLSELMEITCTVDIGLMSINYTCFDGNDSFSQSLCLTNTGVNTSQLNRLENLYQNLKIRNFSIAVRLYIPPLMIYRKYMVCIHHQSLPLSRTCMWSIHIPAWRRCYRDVMCICWCRNRQLYKM